MNALFGFLWILFLFVLCFFLVHFVRLAQFGRTHLRQPSATDSPDKQKQENKDADKNTEKEKAPAQATQEPIYYIVERKRKSKTSFSEPKEIRFK